MKAATMSLLGLMAFFLAAGPALAQAGRGTARLSGIVYDPEGKPVEGARVAISFAQGSAGPKHETKTNKKGEWSFMGLGTGAWELTILMKGYEPRTQSVSVTQLNLNPKVEVTLKRSSYGGTVLQDESTLSLLDLGNQFYSQGKYDEAVASYEQFLEKNPQAYQVQLNIADAYRQKGDFEMARQLYARLIDLAVNDSLLGKQVAGKALAGIGDIYLKQGKLAEAQVYFRKSIESSPDDEVLAYNVAEIYFSNQDLGKALEYFEMAARIKPDWPDPYLKLGYVYLNEHDDAQAVKMFEKFLGLEPEGERAVLAKDILKAIKK
jgi:tetratricopeptide (TPR) repeat protein